jgi:hypothetical protein
MAYVSGWLAVAHTSRSNVLSPGSDTHIMQKFMAGKAGTKDFLRQWVQNYRTELLLFLLLWITYAYFYQSTQHSEAARFDQMRAIVQDHTLEIDRYWWNTADVIRYVKDGSSHVYPNKAPAMVLLTVIPFAAFSTALSSLRIVGLPEWIYWHAVTYVTPC